jgi:hypothetical protein
MVRLGISGGNFRGGARTGLFVDKHTVLAPMVYPDTEVIKRPERNFRKELTATASGEAYPAESQCSDGDASRSNTQVSDQIFQARYRQGEARDLLLRRRKFGDHGAPARFLRPVALRCLQAEWILPTDLAKLAVWHTSSHGRKAALGFWL